MRQDYAKHRRVAEAFYEHARTAVEASELPVLEVNGAQQRGDTFGERLANAVADAFAQGYDQVIAVGSDCPRLHEVDWSAVAERLAAGAPVLGPNPDRQGTYLIGLTRAQFDRDAFAALPWQAPDLLPALAQHLAAGPGPAPVFLAARDDVNGHGELLRLLRTRARRASVLIRHLRALFEPGARPARAERGDADAPVLERRSRAPPLAARTVVLPEGRRA